MSSVTILVMGKSASYLSYTLHQLNQICQLLQSLLQQPFRNANGAVDMFQVMQCVEATRTQPMEQNVNTTVTKNANQKESILAKAHCETSYVWQIQYH